ncbi:MAG: Imidazole glycerol phosphate synthase subunit HisH [Nitrospira sp.]|nr:Imidazole glycerol phosphate synthase subunit HisH [Nitrospira sp.]
MNSPVVAVIDTGVGNLFSLARAIEEVDGAVVITPVPEELSEADLVIIPGVGSFASTMSLFVKTGMAVALRNYAQQGRPLLGICLGMQLLASVGLENGRTLGLGLIQGEACPLPELTNEGAPIRIPHIGWSRVETVQGSAANGWSGMRSTSADLYFAHSFMVRTADPAALRATISYGGHEIAAIIEQDNVTGVQFHPEKSGILGLEFLRNFVFGVGQQ